MKLTRTKFDWTNLKSLFRKKFIIGLDLGSTSLKLAQLVEKDDGLALIRLQSIEKPPSEDSLRELLKGVNIQNSKFFVSINSMKTVMRIIETPPMPKSELKEAIRLESKHYFPFPIEDSFLEFETLGQVVSGDTKKVRIAVAVSPRKTIESSLVLLGKVGIKPASLIPVPAALEKLAATPHVRKDSVRCFADIGDYQTELVILKGNILIFARKIPLGGHDFTQSMMGVLLSDRGKIQLSWDEAERMKRDIGFPRENESRMVGDKISIVQMQSMLRQPLEQLVGEIDRCFDYYREETGGEKVESLVLFGRGASLKGLSEALSEELGITVKVGDPLEGLTIQAQIVKPEQGFSQFAVAIGAALSFGTGINLLPPEIKERTPRTFKRAAIQSAVATATLLLAFVYIGMRIGLGNLQKRIAVAKLEAGSLQSEIQKAEEQSVVSRILAGEPYWEDVFRELSNLVPKDIYLTRFGMANRRLFIKGVIVSNEKERSLSNFILNLEKGTFYNVKLVTEKEAEDKSSSEFELNLWVD